MNLNKKGFAITTMVYAILILLTLFVFVILGTMRNEYSNQKDFINDVKEELNNFLGGTDEETPYDSGLNPPELATGMIPVYYDATCLSNVGCWKKADSTNPDNANKWYDYKDKMWANAVTVTNSGYGIEKTSNKNVSVPVSSSIIYSSTNQGIKSTKSSSIFTFTAGSDGNLSFDWTVSSPSSTSSTPGKLTVTIKTGTSTTETSLVSKFGDDSDTKTSKVTAGKTYTITATYTKGNSTTTSSTATDTATIGNFILPSGSSELVHSVNSKYPDYQWKEEKGSGLRSYNSYEVKDGKFKLLEETIEENITNNYICNDGKSVECEEMYEIKLHDNEKITKVDSYKIKSTSRSDLINSAPGTIILMDRINTMWVWIPRFNATGDTVNENGTKKTSAPGAFNITFVRNTAISAHDAFTFDDEEITGFWMGKFELSSTCTEAENNKAVGVGCNSTDITPTIIPNALSWRGAMVSTFYQVIGKMNADSNIYGFSSSDDIHMIKNNEWGAVAYLTQSVYGRCSNKLTCTQVYINNCSKYNTGVGGAGVSSSSTTTTCTTEKYFYNGETGVNASTTGNIYGVYDMSGGAYEYVMGVYRDGSDYWSGYKTSTSSYQHSGFNGCLGSSCSSSITNGVAYPSNEKYYNLYTTDDDYTSNGLQHAMVETKGWYSDTYSFISGSNPWIKRGGYFDDEADSGIFSYGNATGGAQIKNSSRAALIVNK